MEYLIGGLVLLAIVPLVVALLALELYDNAGRTAERLVNRAVDRLPASSRDRYREEWLAHVEDQPGKLAKLLAALSIYRGSAAVLRELAVPVAVRARRSNGASTSRVLLQKLLSLNFARRPSKIARIVSELLDDAELAAKSSIGWAFWIAVVGAISAIVATLSRGHFW